ncbi:MAG: amidohydrolase family protein [Actinobacteria bacterium]|nr:amidohydrolase family protein [Actinomycetota bacterium]MBU1494773.1 amidohydrolase family protein [Actinomycetota bacterium]
MARQLFTNAAVFDGTGTPPAPGEVLVEDGRILDVGSGLDGDEHVDLGGRTLLPGLFDTHVHVVISHVDEWALLHEPFSLQFYEAAHNLKATLGTGITSIRDGGGADLGIKEAVARGMIAGPRMQISVIMLSQTGGHGDGWLASGTDTKLFMPHPGRPSGVVDGPEEVRRKVRELFRAGADVIKVATSGGVLSPRDDPTHAHFTLAELQMLVAEAASAGKWVMAHAQATDGIKNAIRAGIRSIEHGIYLDDEAIEMMLEHGTYLVPTLVAPSGVLRAAEAGAPIPPVVLDKAEMVVEVHRDSFRRAVAAGVKVAMGTDSGVTPHGENLRELELMAEGGMAPAEVLRATTAVAAELMGVDVDLGTIEPGKIADLVVLEGDPYAFGGYRDRIRAVYQGGVLVAGGV